jgi:acyl-CoA thioester hydrolase
MTAIETLKGYVNTWECDENQHLNVQFYNRFFEDAGGHFQTLTGVPADQRREPRLRHIRYHAELRVNAGLRVETMGVGDSGQQVVHLLYETTKGHLSATCLETFDDPPPGLSDALRRNGGDLPEEAIPRSIDPSPVDPGPDGATPAGGYMTLAARVRANYCRPDGSIFDSGIISLNSDSAAHFWTPVGIDRGWLEARNFGRVAVEMKLTRTGPLSFGDLVHIVSRPIAVARSTITFENRFVQSDTGKVAATVQVTGLTMNLETRRAVPLPDDIRARTEALIAGESPELS